MSYSLGSVEADQRTEFYAEPEGRQPRPRFRGVATGVIALVVVALFAGGMWFAYLQGMRHAVGGSGGEDVPLIRADARPTKVKPEKPGGMEVPDRDKLVYTQKRAAVEHLLPPPEKPMPRPTPPGPGTSAVPPETARSATGPATAATAASSAAATTNPPGKVAAATVAPKPATLPQSPAKANGPRIQLASVRSEEAALQEWNRIKRANSDLLGNLSATPVRVDLGEKGIFYRVLSGPVADADRVCRELNQRNVGCVIAR
jgi:hypothetical protein